MKVFTCDKCGSEVPSREKKTGVCAWCVQKDLDPENGPFADAKLTKEEKIALTRRSERRRLRAAGQREKFGRGARGARA